MFALFWSLYYSMFTGTWKQLNPSQIMVLLKNPLDGLGTFITSIFGDNTYTTLGTIMQDGGFNNVIYNIPLALVAFVLALITSIGIVIMAVKGVKKAFGIFFGHIR